jgi:hypothetical protein
LRVYILSNYEEYGAENVHATLDKARLFNLLERHYGPVTDGDRARLVDFVARDELTPLDEGGDEVVEGWGNVQLHIVELE